MKFCPMYFLFLLWLFLVPCKASSVASFTASVSYPAEATDSGLQQPMLAAESGFTHSIVDSTPVPLHADSIEVISTPDAGVIVGLGASPFYNRAELGDYWVPKPAFSVSGFVTKPLKPWLESRLELQYLVRKQVRTIKHPESYVFEMDVSVMTAMLRLPVTLILITKPTEGKLNYYLGGGISVATPLKARMQSVRHYNTEWVTTYQDIKDQYAKPILGFHGLLGFRFGQAFVELRGARDIESIALPGLDFNDLVPIEIWGVFGTGFDIWPGKR
ncbi:MAG: hypothetical protein PHT47_00480 [Candidatus Cloacimonetes bacterium]|jgi:hypothetical protein|nr:hypothetical protein [Candidatus Cloacimonadota bacterium]